MQLYTLVWDKAQLKNNLENWANYEAYQRHQKLLKNIDIKFSKTKKQFVISFLNLLELKIFVNFTLKIIIKKLIINALYACCLKLLKFSILMHTFKKFLFFSIDEFKLLLQKSINRVLQ